MSISRRSLLRGGLTAGALLGLRPLAGLTQESMPRVTVYKSPG